MKRIVLCTSSSGLDNLNIKTSIRQIRLRVYINNVEFVDGKNINIKRLQEMMAQPSHSPIHTKPAPAEEVAKLLMTLKNEGYEEVFIVTLSSKTSESYNIIKKVAKYFQNSMNIYVYDCKEYSVCEAMLALEAEHMMSQGYSITNIIIRLNDLRSRHKMRFPIEDLSYLIKNKKLSQASGFFANLLNIKPVLQVTDDGAVAPISKIRNFDRAMTTVVEEFVKDYQLAPPEETFVYMVSAGRPDFDKRLMTMVKERIAIKHLPILPVSTIVLANHGPTGVGLCRFLGDKPETAKHFEA